MKFRIRLDNRSPDNLTFAAFEDCDSDLSEKLPNGYRRWLYTEQQVIAREDESGTEWWARIAAVDYRKGLVYLAVQWEDPIQTPKE